jgi:hypothetical protein
MDGHSESITLIEGGAGWEVPFMGGLSLGAGSYFTERDEGMFFFANGGAIGEHGALGFGFSTHDWFGWLEDAWH